MSKPIFISYFIMDELNLCGLAITDNGMVYDTKPFHIDKTMEDTVKQITEYYGIDGEIHDPDLISRFKSYDPDFKTIFIGDIKHPDSPEYEEKMREWEEAGCKRPSVNVPIDLLF